MQHGMVDLCITGTDRTTYTGDVCNKIGTYLKALAAQDNSVPFYVGLPSPTIDWTAEDGVRDIPIEERGTAEVTLISGRGEDGRLRNVQPTPDASPRPTTPSTLPRAISSPDLPQNAAFATRRLTVSSVFFRKWVAPPVRDRCRHEPEDFPLKCPMTTVFNTVTVLLPLPLGNGYTVF